MFFSQSSMDRRSYLSEYLLFSGSNCETSILDYIFLCITHLSGLTFDSRYRPPSHVLYGVDFCEGWKPDSPRKETHFRLSFLFAGREKNSPATFRLTETQCHTSKVHYHIHADMTPQARIVQLKMLLRLYETKIVKE